LVPAARCVALLAGLRGGRLIARPSFFQLDNLRRARRAGQPWHLIVHEDVLIFRNPVFPASSPQTAAGPASSAAASRRASAARRRKRPVPGGRVGSPARTHGPPRTAPRTRTSAPHGRPPRCPGTTPASAGRCAVWPLQPVVPGAARRPGTAVDGRPPVSARKALPAAPDPWAPAITELSDLTLHAETSVDAAGPGRQASRACPRHHDPATDDAGSGSVPPATARDPERIAHGHRAHS